MISSTSTSVPSFSWWRIRESGTVSALKSMWGKLSPKEIEALPITEKDFSRLNQVDWIKIEKDRRPGRNGGSKRSSRREPVGPPGRMRDGSDPTIGKSQQGLRDPAGP